MGRKQFTEQQIAQALRQPKPSPKEPRRSHSKKLKVLPSQPDADRVKTFCAACGRF